jgi:hypothetical protein
MYCAPCPVLHCNASPVRIPSPHVCVGEHSPHGQCSPLLELCCSIQNHSPCQFVTCYVHCRCPNQSNSVCQYMYRLRVHVAGQSKSHDECQFHSHLTSGSFPPNVCVGQHCTALYCPALYCTILYCTKPHDLNGTVSSPPVAVLSPHAAKHCLYYLLITNIIFAPLYLYHFLIQCKVLDVPLSMPAALSHLWQFCLPTLVLANAVPRSHTKVRLPLSVF